MAKANQAKAIAQAEKNKLAQQAALKAKGPGGKPDPKKTHPKSNTGVPGLSMKTKTVLQNKLGGSKDPKTLSLLNRLEKNRWLDKALAAHLLSLLFDPLLVGDVHDGLLEAYFNQGRGHCRERLTR